MVFELNYLCAIHSFPVVCLDPALVMHSFTWCITPTSYVITAKEDKISQNVGHLQKM